MQRLVDYHDNCGNIRTALFKRSGVQFDRPSPVSLQKLTKLGRSRVAVERHVGMSVTFNECPLLTSFLPVTAPTE
ncbi:hypothetical protein ACFQUU_25120 [Herbaspirillum sp. GCM10030257]|uniref:hypothetical protein n=1 Tax=Herbaspirillum sp. GCM10030257 TaxID=3273393 RepID=UPI00360F9171